MEFFLPLLTIICIDLVLAGDNAVVIALAVRELPQKMRCKAIVFGTAGAVIVRIIMALLAVYLLQIPYLLCLGGIVLLPIALKLLRPSQVEKEKKAPITFLGAIKLIVIADAVMGLDNVLAIAGAAGGHYGFIIFGILISVPILAWGSGMIARAMDKYSFFVLGGASILAYTAGTMVMHDAIVGSFLRSLGPLEYILPALSIAIVVIYFYVLKKTEKV